jgi:cell division protein FtsN
VRFLLSVAACLLLTQGLRAENYTVRVQETAIVEMAGATAAYTTNPDIADVAIAGAGRISVTGHRAGTTQLVVITAGNSQSFLITVAAAVRPAVAPDAGAAQTRYEGRYTSGIARVQNAVDITTHDGVRSSELSVIAIHDLQTVRGEPSDIIASIFYRNSAPGRVLTLLDDMVDVSRTTVSSTQIRGLHLRDGGLELHAGYASSAVYDGFFLPTDRRWVGGAGYSLDAGGMRWTPSVYAFFSEPDRTAARRGVVAALSAEHRSGESLFIRGDVGVSRSIAASGEVRYASPRSDLRALFSHKSNDFPTLGLSDVPGTHAELDWSRRATERLSITTAGSFDRFRFAAVHQTIGTARAGLRFAITRQLAVSAGADISEVRSPLVSIRTIGVPLSVSYDAPAFGVAGSYRLLENSSASRHGDALRFSAHAGNGRLTANVWAERQRQAPTLDLIFSAEPGLELALLRLGVSAHTPEDVARALRDNAALIDLGFITGVNVNLTPRRLQAGFNLAWSGSGAHSDHLRLLAVFGRDQGISAQNDSFLTTLSYSRRVLTATDLFASYSWWRAGLATRQESGTSLELGLRQQFSGTPGFLQRGGAIDGFAFLDPEMAGVRGPRTPPLGGIAVTLDSAQTTRTDARGAYRFDHVPPGLHEIAAQLPSAARAFFTTPSRSSTKAPAHVDFGLTWAAARIEARLVSDRGVGVAGAVFSATPSNGTAIGATSDGDGRVVFAVPPGEFLVAFAADSLPPGYLIAGESAKRIKVEADQPQSLSFQVNAIRSVSGRAPAASAVRIESLGRTSQADAEGNFVFRSMPAGTFVVTSRSAGGIASASVILPDVPATIRGVVLGAESPRAESAASQTAPPVRAPSDVLSSPAARSSLSGQSGFRIQAGTFRVASNAAAAVHQIEQLGGQARITRSGSFDVVTVGPFATSEEAEAEAQRLRGAHIDVVVVSDRKEQPRSSPVAIGAHVVQAGAFRESRNADDLIGRLHKLGEQPFTVTARGLTIVCIGPFDGRQDAVVASERLRRAGLEGIVARR